MQASIAAGSVPTTWIRGQSQQVTVTVTNTGAQKWIAGGSNPANLIAYFLSGPLTSIPGQNWVQQTIYQLPHDVAPGESITATFTVKAPNRACCTKLAFQMSIKGILTLPDPAVVNITIN